MENMKRYGYLKKYLHFKLYNSTKMEYKRHKTLGALELPSTSKSKDIYELHSNYIRSKDYSKYLNPKGLKQTIPASFPQPQQEINFLSHEIMLMRSPKDYKPSTLCFRTSPFISKYEFLQYVSKVYNLPVNNVRSVNKMGKIMNDKLKRKYYRKKDFKKFILDLHYNVNPTFQKNEAIN